MRVPLVPAPDSPFRRSRIAAALGVLVSAECFFALFLFSNNIKLMLQSFVDLPLDETLLFLVISVISGTLVLLRRGIYVEGFVTLVAGAAFLAYVAATSLWSPSLFMVRREMMLMLPLGTWSLVAAALVVAPERERVRRFLTVTALVGLAATVHGWFLRFTLGDFVFSPEWGRIGFRAFYQLSGQMAGTTAVVLAALALEGRGGPWVRTVLFLGAIVCFAFTFMAGSRLAMIGMLTGLFLVIVTLPLRVGRGRLEISRGHLVALAGVAGAVVALIYVEMADIPLTALERLRGAMARIREDSGILARYDRPNYLRVAFQVWLSAPFFGVGLMGFAPVGFLGEGPGGHPHNLILQILAETGLVGLALFLLFLWSAYRHLGWRRLQTDRLLAAVLAASAVPWAGAMFADSFATLGKFYAFLALVTLPPPSPGAETRASPLPPSVGGSSPTAVRFRTRVIR